MDEKEEKKKENDPYSLKRIYENMELELIDSFYRNLKRHAKEEKDLGFSWEMWQSATLRNLEKYRKEVLKITKSYSKEVEDAIKEVLEKSYDQGEEHVEKGINLPKDGENVGKVNMRPPAVSHFFGTNKKKLNALIEATTNDFKNADRAIYRQMDDVFRQVIHNTEFQLSAGAISLQKAIDMASENFLKRGINCITYQNGRRVNIATYAEMCLRTASQRATFLGEGTKRDEYKTYLILVSVHANACELCIPWQGEILIDDVFAHPSKEYIANNNNYKLLSTAIKAGFLHPNCRHTLINYIEGVTRIPKKVASEKALENYKNEQIQRQLENKIRKQKRIVKGTVDPENKKDESRKLRDLQREMRNFLMEHPEFKRNSLREKDRLGPLTTEEKDDILKLEIKNILKLPKAVVNLEPDIPKNISDYAFDEKHINAERQHQVTKEQSLKWIENAKLSVVVWKGRFTRYYSEHGTVYVDNESKLIRTAYAKREYSEDVLRILEVLDKNGR